MAYDPRQGPPSWYANGRGTAKTQEEFQQQKQLYSAYNVDAGLSDPSGGNLHAYGAGLPTPEQNAKPVDMDALFARYGGGGGGLQKTDATVTDYVPPGGGGPDPYDPSTFPNPFDEIDIPGGGAGGGGTGKGGQGGTGGTGGTGGSATPTTTQAPPGYKPQPFNLQAFKPPPPPAPPPAPPPPPNFMAFTQQVPGYQTPENAFMGEDLYGDLEGYAKEWMANPNRYLSDLATKTREAGDLRRKEDEQGFMRDLDEWAAGRGLVGSSYEGEQVVDMKESLARARADEEARLLEMIASAETADRQAAGQYGLQTGEFARGLGSDRRQDAQFAQNDALARAELNLTAAMAGDNAAMDRVRHELDVMRSLDAMTMDRSQLELQDKQIEQRTWEIMMNAELEGRRISQADAALQAEIEQRKADREQRRIEEENRDRRERERLEEEKRQHDDIMDAQYGGEAEKTETDKAVERRRIERGEFPEGWNVMSMESRRDYLAGLGFLPEQIEKYANTAA